MGKYFGTDGIRGVYGQGMTEALAFKAGAAFGFLLGGVCVAGRDTRASGGALLDAFISGLTAAGADALVAGIVPTPALSFLVRTKYAAGGVMVSASHNPPEYNGLKIFGADGIKLSAAQEEAIEFYIDNPVVLPAVAAGAIRRGRVSFLSNSAEIYINDIVAGSGRLDGVRVWLDCGFGAAGACTGVKNGKSIAREVFSRLGAEYVCLNEGGDGSRINVDCGALYAESLKDLMKDEAGIGFAFDGDADRMVMVYKGEVLDGDSVLYALSRLREGGVVGTVMSNLALKGRLKEDGKAFFTADVGDKNILELILQKSCGLGGEQSGHYIFYPERVTGDGLLAAVKMAGAYLNGGIERLTLVPQKTISLLCDKKIMQSERLKNLKAEAERELSRVVVRFSGTEPKIRIMAEDGDEKKLDEFLDEFKKLVASENTL